MSFLFFQKRSRDFRAGKEESCERNPGGVSFALDRIRLRRRRKRGPRPGRRAGRGGHPQDVLFVFSKEKQRLPRREGTALFCGSIPLGCCFSFLLALFIWAGRGTIQTVKKTEKARGAAAENEVTYADFRYPCPL